MSQILYALACSISTPELIKIFNQTKTEPAQTPGRPLEKPFQFNGELLMIRIRCIFKKCNHSFISLGGII